MQEDGRVEAIVDETAAGDDVQHVNGILTPGLINCHCHLELSHMTGRIPQGTGLPAFLLHVMQERTHDIEEINQAMALADDQMYQQGIVAVGDICNTTHSIPVKLKSRIRYYNFIETMGVISEKADARFEQSRSVWEKFAASGANNFIGNSIVPHAPYSVSPALFERISSFEKNKVVSIHSQESAAEKEFLSNGTGAFLDFFTKAGLTPADMLDAIGKNGDKSSLHALSTFQSTQNILVHNVVTDNSDIDFALQQFAAHSPFWCLCPQANLYISRQLPDVTLLFNRNLQLVFGTDSLASNTQLSLISEINSIRSHFPHIPDAALLAWATINGAKALQIDAQLGSFEPGKTPGLTRISELWNETARLM